MSVKIDISLVSSQKSDPGPVFCRVGFGSYGSQPYYFSLVNIIIDFPCDQSKVGGCRNPAHQTRNLSKLFLRKLFIGIHTYNQGCGSGWLLRESGSDLREKTGSNAQENNGSEADRQ